MSSKYTFSSRHGWTSYIGLSGEEEKAIEDSNYDQIPKEWNGVAIFEDGFFAPYYYEKENSLWVNRRSGWCEHRQTGLKVRLVISKSPDYDHVNGHGECYKVLEIFEPGPASLENLRKIANQWAGDNIFQDLFYQSPLVDIDKTADAPENVVVLTDGSRLIFDAQLGWV